MVVPRYSVKHSRHWIWLTLTKLSHDSIRHMWLNSHIIDQSPYGPDLYGDLIAEGLTMGSLWATREVHIYTWFSNYPYNANRTNVFTNRAADMGNRPGATSNSGVQTLDGLPITR